MKTDPVILDRNNAAKVRVVASADSPNAIFSKMRRRSESVMHSSRPEIIGYTFQCRYWPTRIGVLTLKLLQQLSRVGYTIKLKANFVLYCFVIYIFCHWGTRKTQWEKHPLKADCSDQILCSLIQLPPDGATSRFPLVALYTPASCRVMTARPLKCLNVFMSRSLKNARRVLLWSSFLPRDLI